MHYTLIPLALQTDPTTPTRPQYFYTLSELRQIVAQADLFKEDLQALPSKAEKRVGGRVVTRKEIERSIRCEQRLGPSLAHVARR